MSTMIAAAGQDHFARNDAIRRRNAEMAYNRTEKYNGTIQNALKKLENLITGENELDESKVIQQKPDKLDAGQMKQVSLPIGQTLEETIDLWRDVRSEAISVPEPTTVDHQLAATASSKIRSTEAQLGLEQRIQSDVKQAAYREGIRKKNTTSIELPSSQKWEDIELQKRFEKAVSSYSFQIDMQKRGFTHDVPSFYKVA